MLKKIIWMCTFLRQNSFKSVIPHSLLWVNVTWKSYCKTCHSIQAYLIRGESGTGNYLTCKCMVNKILTKFWQLLKTCLRPVEVAVRSAFSDSGVTWQDTVPGQSALLVVVGKGPGGSGTGSKQGQLLWGPCGQEMRPGGKDQGLVLTFPVWLAESRL